MVKWFMVIGVLALLIGCGVTAGEPEAVDVVDQEQPAASQVEVKRLLKRVGILERRLAALEREVRQIKQIASYQQSTVPYQRHCVDQFLSLSVSHC